MAQFCSDILEVYPVTIINSIGITMVFLGFTYLLMGLAIVYFIKIQEFYAKKGNDSAVKSVIFPVFVTVLWANAMVNVYVGFVALIFTFQPFQNGNKTSEWVFSIMWALQHFIIEGIALMLMQKGLGAYAAKQAFKYSAVWALVTLFLQLAIYSTKPTTSFVISIFWQCLLLGFYLPLWLMPGRRLFRRPALIFYAKFWVIFRVISIITSIFYFIPYTAPAGKCAYVFGTLFPIAILEPLVVYYTLLQDSRWWQGMDIVKPGNRMSGVESNIRSPMQGIDLNLRSAQTLAESLDQMESKWMIKSKSHNTAVLSSSSTELFPSSKPTVNVFENREAHETDSNAEEADEAPSSMSSPLRGVRLLNFAYILLDKSKQLGAGSFSKVYAGKYRDRRCAIKLVYTMDLTQEVIRRIVAEAQILSRIRHANVVEILGVSVLPPSVCLLLELCTFGSLADVIKSAVVQLPCGVEMSEDDVSSFMAGCRITAGKRTVSIRQPIWSANNGKPVPVNIKVNRLNLSWPDRLHLAIGCARGLAALHRFSSDLCHRDIKSFNFLVDSQFNAKIADLELGVTDDMKPQRRFMSRLPKRRHGGSSLWKSLMAFFNAESIENVEKKKKSQRKKSYKHPVSPPSSDIKSLSVSSSSHQSSTELEEAVYKANDFALGETSPFDNDEFLANWSAPEVIQDGVYTQASDVYSFSLVLWEILTGSVPFTELRRQEDVRYQILSCQRPMLPLLPRSCGLGDPTQRPGSVKNGAPNGTNCQTFSASLGLHAINSMPADLSIEENMTMVMELAEKQLRLSNCQSLWRFMRIIAEGWRHDAATRPSIQSILADLEDLYLLHGLNKLSETDAIPHNLTDVFAQPQHARSPSPKEAEDSVGLVDPSMSVEQNMQKDELADPHSSQQSPPPHPPSANLVAPNARSSLFTALWPFSSTGSQLTPALLSNAGMVSMIMKGIVQNLRIESTCLSQLEMTGAAWVLVMPELVNLETGEKCPDRNIVLWASSEFCRQVDLHISEMSGQALLTLPFFKRASMYVDDEATLELVRNQAADRYQENGEFLDAMEAFIQTRQAKLKAGVKNSLVFNVTTEDFVLDESLVGRASHPSNDPFAGVASKRSMSRASQGSEQVMGTCCSLYSVAGYPIYRRRESAASFVTSNPFPNSMNGGRISPSSGPSRSNSPVPEDGHGINSSILVHDDEKRRSPTNLEQGIASEKSMQDSGPIADKPRGSQAPLSESESSIGSSLASADDFGKSPHVLVAQRDSLSEPLPASPTKKLPAFQLFRKKSSHSTTSDKKASAKPVIVAICLTHLKEYKLPVRRNEGSQNAAINLLASLGVKTASSSMNVPFGHLSKDLESGPLSSTLNANTRTNVKPNVISEIHQLESKPSQSPLHHNLPTP